MGSEADYLKDPSLLLRREGSEMLELLRPQELCLMLDGIQCNPRDWQYVEYYDGALLVKCRIYKGVVTCEHIGKKSHLHRQLELPNTYPVMLGKWHDHILVRGADQTGWVFIYNSRILMQLVPDYSFRWYRLPSYSQMLNEYFTPGRWLRFQRWLWKLLL